MKIQSNKLNDMLNDKKNKKQEEIDNLLKNVKPNFSRTNSYPDKEFEITKQ